jgi:hypothetical protein
MCTILLGIAERERPETYSVGSSATLPQAGASSKSSVYYYGGHAIVNGTYLIGCILMHIDIMLKNHPRFKRIENTDSTHMDVKEWYNLCNYVLNADKRSKAGLRIPKVSDEDFRAAVAVVASPVSGRKPARDASHIVNLLSSCPAIMTTVEWMRSALLRCTGVLSPERTCRFRLIKHPFVNENSELAVEETSILRLPNRWMHQDVMTMKATAKKEYMRLILEDSIKPADAIGMVRVKQ